MDIGYLQEQREGNTKIKNDIKKLKQILKKLEKKNSNELRMLRDIYTTRIENQVVDKVITKSDASLMLSANELIYKSRMQKIGELEYQLNEETDHLSVIEDGMMESLLKQIG